MNTEIILKIEIILCINFFIEDTIFTESFLTGSTGKNMKLNRTILRQGGKSYLDRKGNRKESVQFFFQECKCRQNCSRVSLSERKSLFDEYWQLGDWSLQSAFLIARIVEVSCFVCIFNLILGYDIR